MIILKFQDTNRYWQRDSKRLDLKQRTKKGNKLMLQKVKGNHF